MISDLAVIDSTAVIAEDVEIGPFTVVGPRVEIGSGTWIGPHAVIKGPTRIGKNNKIFQFASVGDDTQDKKYQGEETWLEIGDGNTIREFCTINRGSIQDQALTKIGNNNLLMAYVHIAHDCMIGNDTIFANNASLAGHVKVEDYVVLGGFCGIHQFCRLSQHSFIASNAMVIKDVLPYIRVAGTYAKPYGLNTVGLQRRGFTSETISCLKKAYKIIYRQNLTAREALEALRPLVAECKEVQRFVDAIEHSERGIVR